MKSIEAQKSETVSLDDIEVLLVDDCSTQNFSGVVNQFPDLHISIYTTEVNGGPGPSRQRGTEHATGEWITFIDQDDEFIPNTFAKVKEEIEKNPTIRTMVNTPFYVIDWDTKQQTDYYPDADNWIHGKFYHREEFLLKYNIHFCEDLFSHEDIYFSTLVKGVLSCANLPYIQCDTPTYYWYTYHDSLSHRSTETGFNYLEEYYGEYIDSILMPVKLIDDRFHSQEFLSSQLLTLLLFGYFYIQGFLFYNSRNFKRDNLAKFKELLTYVKERLGLRNDQIISWTYNNPKVYWEIRDKAAKGTGPMIETQSYATFVELIDPEGQTNGQTN